MSDEHRERIERRIETLTAWLKETAPEAVEEQRHLDADSDERTYWHYGYLVALRDVRDLLTNKRTDLH